MFNREYFFFDSKEHLLRRTAKYRNPCKVSFWTGAGIPMVIDRRESYSLHEISGKRLIDLHLNGESNDFELGRPEFVEMFNSGLDDFDIASHWLLSVAYVAFAEGPTKPAPHMKYAILGGGWRQTNDHTRSRS